MLLTRASLRNRVAVTVAGILIILFGVISLFRLPVQLSPDIERPVISIQTGWRAAAMCCAAFPACARCPQAHPGAVAL